jgi:DinB superfamily
MFRSIARVVLPIGMVSVFVFAPLANAQISPNLPNPIAAPNPLITTLSIFRSNMQDKIMKAADAMPESKYSYRPTKDVRSFAEIVTHVADISYILCANAKGETPPRRHGLPEGFEDRDRGLPQRRVRVLRWRVLRVHRCAPQ